MTATHSKAQILTVAFLLAVLGAGLAQRSGWRLPFLWRSQAARASQDPQDAIYEMVNAARAGNVNRYLACFTGSLSSTLRRALSESAESAFAQSLRDANTGIKGIAVGDPQETGGQEVKVRVEYVYQDRNEGQTMYLERRGGGWKIARSDGEERLRTLIPYGTPVK